MDGVKRGDLKTVSENNQLILEKIQEGNGLKDFVEFIGHSWCVIKDCTGCLFDAGDECILGKSIIKI